MSQNRGKIFEHIIKQAFQKVSGVSIDRLYDQTTGFKGSVNPCDFIVYHKPYLFPIECKSIHGNTFPFSAFRQYQNMLTYKGIEGLYPGVILWLSDHDKVLWIPIETFEKLKAEVRTERGYSSMREHLPDLLEYYLVSPQKLNRRIMNQDGAFILCGLLDEIYSSNPLDVENIENYSFLEKLRVEVNGKRIILIVKNKDYIMKQLNVYGINQTRIYPEIDKVAEYIKNRLTRGC